MTNKFTATILASVFLITITSCNSGDKSNDRNINLIQDSTSFENNTTTDTTAVQAQQPEQNQQNSSEATPVTKATTPVKKTKTPSKVVTQPQSTTPVATNPEVTSTSTGNQEAAGNTVTSEGEKKTGISKTAKGAIIGGAAGAVGGAIISKKKGVGAVVGGAVGAAAGAIIGKQKDKKDKAKEEATEQTQKQ